MSIEISPDSPLVKYFWCVQGDIVYVPDAEHTPGAAGELTRQQAIDAISGGPFTPEYAIYDIAADYSTFTEERLGGAETPWSVTSSGFTVYTTYADGSAWEHFDGANKNAWLFEVTLKSGAYSAESHIPPGSGTADLVVHSSYSLTDGPQEFGVLMNGQPLYDVLDKLQVWRGPNNFNPGPSEPAAAAWQHFMGAYEIP